MEQRRTLQSQTVWALWVPQSSRGARCFQAHLHQLNSLLKPPLEERTLEEPTLEERTPAKSRASVAHEPALRSETAPFGLASLEWPQQERELLPLAMPPLAMPPLLLWQRRTLR